MISFIECVPLPRRADNESLEHTNSDAQARGSESIKCISRILRLRVGFGIRSHWHAHCRVVPGRASLF